MFFSKIVIMYKLIILNLQIYSSVRYFYYLLNCLTSVYLRVMYHNLRFVEMCESLYHFSSVPSNGAKKLFDESS